MNNTYTLPIIGNCLVCGNPATSTNKNLIVCFDCVTKQVRLDNFLVNLLCPVCKNKLIPTFDYIPPLPVNYIKCPCGWCGEVKPQVLLGVDIETPK